MALYAVQLLRSAKRGNLLTYEVWAQQAYDAQYSTCNIPKGSRVSTYRAAVV